MTETQSEFELLLFVLAWQALRNGSQKWERKSQGDISGRRSDGEWSCAVWRRSEQRLGRGRRPGEDHQQDYREERTSTRPPRRPPRTPRTLRALQDPGRRRRRQDRALSGSLTGESSSSSAEDKEYSPTREGKGGKEGKISGRGRLGGFLVSRIGRGGTSIHFYSTVGQV